MKKSDDKDRNAIIDVLRGLGIMLVVYAHACLPGAIIIEYFHMPLFFFISGTVASKSTVKKTVIGYIKKYYMPLITIQILLIPLHNLFWKMGIESEKYSSYYQYFRDALGVLLLDVRVRCVSQVWFLMILGIDYILIRFMICLFETKPTAFLLVAVGCATITWILPHAFYANTYPIQLIGIALFWSSIGYLFIMNKDTIIQAVKSRWIKGPAGVCFAIIILLGGYLSLYILGFKIGYRGLDFSCGYLATFLIAFFGIVLCGIISIIITKHGIGALEWIGKNTMLIFFLHPLAIDILGSTLLITGVMKDNTNWIVLFRESFWPYISFVVGMAVPCTVILFYHMKNRYKEKSFS